MYAYLSHSGYKYGENRLVFSELKELSHVPLSKEKIGVSEKKNFFALT